MRYTHTICPNDASGQHNNVNEFAYNNNGKRCALIGRAMFMTFDREQGMRQCVELENGNRGFVWEDELEKTCIQCDAPAWSCDCGESE